MIEPPAFQSSCNSVRILKHQTTLEANKSDISGPNLNETIDKSLISNPTNNFQEAEENSEIMRNPSNSANHPEDLTSLLHSLSQIKAQRDQYKAILDSITSRFEEKGIKSRETYDTIVKDSIEEVNSLDDVYGKNISDYIDKLNMQMDFLRVKMLEENSIGFSKNDDIMSKDLSQVLAETSNHRNKNHQNPNMSSRDLKLKQKKIRQKWISVDYTPEHSDKGLDQPHKSILDLQAKLGYFPQRIRELEEENKKMGVLIKKLQENELSKENTKKLQEKQEFNDKKKEEMEKLYDDLKDKQKTFEEKVKELDIKRQELEEKEKALELKETLMKIKENGEEEKIMNDSQNPLDIQHYNQGSLPHRPIMKISGNNSNNEKQIKSLPFCNSCLIY